MGLSETGEGEYELIDFENQTFGQEVSAFIAMHKKTIVNKIMPIVSTLVLAAATYAISSADEKSQPNPEPDQNPPALVLPELEQSGTNVISTQEPEYAWPNPKPAIPYRGVGDAQLPDGYAVALTPEQIAEQVALIQKPEDEIGTVETETEEVIEEEISSELNTALQDEADVLIQEAFGGNPAKRDAFIFTIFTNSSELGLGELPLEEYFMKNTFVPYSPEYQPGGSSGNTRAWSDPINDAWKENSANEVKLIKIYLKELERLALHPENPYDVALGKYNALMNKYHEMAIQVLGDENTRNQALELVDATLTSEFLSRYSLPEQYFRPWDGNRDLLEFYEPGIYTNSRLLRLATEAENERLQLAVKEQIGRPWAPYIGNKSILYQFGVKHPIQNHHSGTDWSTSAEGEKLYSVCGGSSILVDIGEHGTGGMGKNVAIIYCGNIVDSRGDSYAIYAQYGHAEERTSNFQNAEFFMSEDHFPRTTGNDEPFLVSGNRGTSFTTNPDGTTDVIEDGGVHHLHLNWVAVPIQSDIADISNAPPGLNWTANDDGTVSLYRSKPFPNSAIFFSFDQSDYRVRGETSQSQNMTQKERMAKLNQRPTVANIGKALGSPGEKEQYREVAQSINERGRLKTRRKLIRAVEVDIETALLNKDFSTYQFLSALKNDLTGKGNELVSVSALNSQTQP